MNNDTISRKQAIGCLRDGQICGDYCRRAIEQLPPAQPEPCEDAVSRTAVQYLLAHFVDEDKYVDACDGLKHLPPVTPKQRTGKWIPVDSYSAFGGDEATWMAHGNPVAFYYCSECKEHAYAGEDGDDILSKFCPNCGAKMTEGVEE